MQNKLQSSLLNSNQYLEMSWVEFNKNFEIFLCLSLLVCLPTVLWQLFFLDLSIIGISPELLVLLTTAPVIERSIRSQTVNIGVALKNIVPKYFIALVASLIFFYSYSLGVTFELPSSFFRLDSSLIIIGILLLSILLSILGIFSWIILSFAYHAIVLRNCRLDAFNYSWALIKSCFWTVFWRYTITHILFFIKNLLPLLIFTVFAMPFILGSSFLLYFSSVGIERAISIVILLIINLIENLISYYFAIINTIIFLNFDYTHTKVQPNLLQ